MPVLIAVDDRPYIARNGHISRFNADRVDVKVLSTYCKLSELCEKAYLLFVEAVNVGYPRYAQAFPVFEYNTVILLYILFLHGDFVLSFAVVPYYAADCKNITILTENFVAYFLKKTLAKAENMCYNNTDIYYAIVCMYNYCLLTLYGGNLIWKHWKLSEEQ